MGGFANSFPISNSPYSQFAASPAAAGAAGASDPTAAAGAPAPAPAAAATPGSVAATPPAGLLPQLDPSVVNAPYTPLQLQPLQTHKGMADALPPDQTPQDLGHVSGAGGVAYLINQALRGVVQGHQAGVQAAQQAFNQNMEAHQRNYNDQQQQYMSGIKSGAFIQHDEQGNVVYDANGQAQLNDAGQKAMQDRNAARDSLSQHVHKYLDPIVNPKGANGRAKKPQPAQPGATPAGAAPAGVATPGAPPAGGNGIGAPIDTSKLPGAPPPAPPAAPPQPGHVQSLWNRVKNIHQNPMDGASALLEGMDTLNNSSDFQAAPYLSRQFQEQRVAQGRSGAMTTASTAGAAQMQFQRQQAINEAGQHPVGSPEYKADMQRAYDIDEALSPYRAMSAHNVYSQTVGVPTKIPDGHGGTVEVMMRPDGTINSDIGTMNTVKPKQGWAYDPELKRPVSVQFDQNNQIIPGSRNVNAQPPAGMTGQVNARQSLQFDEFGKPHIVTLNDVRTPMGGGGAGLSGAQAIPGAPAAAAETPGSAVATPAAAPATAPVAPASQHPHRATQAAAHSSPAGGGGGGGQLDFLHAPKLAAWDQKDLTDAKVNVSNATNAYNLGVAAQKAPNSTTDKLFIDATVRAMTGRFSTQQAQWFNSQIGGAKMVFDNAGNMFINGTLSPTQRQMMIDSAKAMRNTQQQRLNTISQQTGLVGAGIATGVTHPTPASGIIVQTPGGSFSFKTQADADAFKLKAGIK